MCRTRAVINNKTPKMCSVTLLEHCVTKVTLTTAALEEKLAKVPQIYSFRILGKLVFPLVSILLPLSAIVPSGVSDLRDAFGRLPSVAARSSNTNRVTKQRQPLALCSRQMS